MNTNINDIIFKLDFKYSLSLFIFSVLCLHQKYILNSKMKIIGLTIVTNVVMYIYIINSN